MSEYWPCVSEHGTGKRAATDVVLPLALVATTDRLASSINYASLQFVEPNPVQTSAAMASKQGHTIAVQHHRHSIVAHD